MVVIRRSSSLASAAWHQVILRVSINEQRRLGKCSVMQCSRGDGYELELIETLSGPLWRPRALLFSAFMPPRSPRASVSNRGAILRDRQIRSAPPPSSQVAVRRSRMGHEVVALGLSAGTGETRAVRPNVRRVERPQAFTEQGDTMFSISSRRSRSLSNQHRHLAP